MSEVTSSIGTFSVIRHKGLLEDAREVTLNMHSCVQSDFDFLDEITVTNTYCMDNLPSVNLQGNLGSTQ
jgi:hypothetical protein